MDNRFFPYKPTDGSPIRIPFGYVRLSWQDLPFHFGYKHTFSFGYIGFYLCTLSWYYVELALRDCKAPFSIAY